jgi:hypothetical protein
VQVLVEGGGGTGFFVRRDRDLFLVTARHVLVNPQTGQLWSREGTLRALSKDVKETAVTCYSPQHGAVAGRAAASHRCHS